MWQALVTFAAGCGNKSLFGIPTWYKYLNGTPKGGSELGCDFAINNINDFLKIVAALIDIALRIGVLLAVSFIIFGGIKFIVSQGDPQGIASARDTIINAVIGLIIAMAATAVVSFVAGRF